jgi:hypothetical protein
MKAWLQLVSIGVIGGLLASSCVITSDDDDDDDGEGGEAGEETGGRPTGGRPSTTGGRPATGGSGTGGATGGRASTTGGASTGGASTGGMVNACDVEEFEPADSCAFMNDDACSSCLSAKCCDEVKDCYAEDPVKNRCGYGITDNDDSQFVCTASCLADIYADGDVPTEEDIDTCAGTNDCMTCALPNFATIGLAQCVVDSCLDECLGAG